MRLLRLSRKASLVIVAATLLCAVALSQVFTGNSGSGPPAGHKEANSIQRLDSVGIDVPDELVPDIVPDISTDLNSVFGHNGVAGTSNTGSMIGQVGPPAGSVSQSSLSNLPPQGKGNSGQSVATGGNVVPQTLDDQEQQSLSGEDGEADGPGEDGKSTDGASTASAPGAAGGKGESERDGADGDEGDEGDEDEDD
ncbi:MAG: hypothetical protein ACT4OM_00300 [Actinomycetota bacterium]